MEEINVIVELEHISWCVFPNPYDVIHSYFKKIVLPKAYTVNYERVRTDGSLLILNSKHGIIF